MELIKKVQKKMDELMTAISAVLLVSMFAVIIANVFLRFIPAVGGFSWYMEFAQYANVWAMLLGAVGIACAGTNLRVELIDSLLKSRKSWRKFAQIIMDLSQLIFYAIMTYSGFLLSSRAKQQVSTMPQFTMGQVYMIFPVAGMLCIIAVLLHLAVTISQAETVEVDVVTVAAVDAVSSDAATIAAAKAVATDKGKEASET